MAMATLNSAVVQVPPVCTVSQLPWWGHPCVFLVLGKLGHDMVKHLLSIWKETSLVFQSPIMPSESDSNLKRRCSSFFWWWALRCLQLFYTIDWRSAFCIFGIQYTRYTFGSVQCVIVPWLRYCFSLSARSVLEPSSRLMIIVGKVISSMVIVLL